MGVITSDQDIYADLLGESPECFYCSKPVDGRGVCWIGSFELVLHAECTVELMIRLMRDVHEYELRSKRYVTSRTTDDLRDRLRAEEGLLPRPPFDLFGGPAQ